MFHINLIFILSFITILGIDTSIAQEYQPRKKLSQLDFDDEPTSKAEETPTPKDPASQLLNMIKQNSKSTDKPKEDSANTELPPAKINPKKLFGSVITE